MEEMNMAVIKKSLLGKTASSKTMAAPAASAKAVTPSKLASPRIMYAKAALKTSKVALKTSKVALKTTRYLV
jgi:hypothetical protein